MSFKKAVPESALAALAKRVRTRAGKSRAQAARDMKVAQASIFRAEENPAESLLKLRIRMIETYSPYRVKGPVFFLTEK
jgi:DNA-binding XRE family transcriptional regulator